MREHSVYQIRCICGWQVEAKTEKLDCPNCGRHLEVQWQDRYIDSKTAPGKPLDAPKSLEDT